MISIIIPVYNRHILIKECLDSVISQTYSNWECIVIDDGSTDNTWEVLQEFAHKENRIRVYRRDREPKGASTCRNMGIDLSKGEYLMFLDSDDLLGEKCLEFRMKKVNEFPDLDAWIFDMAIFQKQIGDDKRMWNKLITNNDDLIRFLRQDMPWGTSGPIWMNNNLLRFDENAMAFQDWEYHIRNLLSGIQYKKFSTEMKNTFIYCRRDNHTLTISTHNNAEKRNNILTIIHKTCLQVIEHKKGQEQYEKAVFKTLIKWARNARLDGNKKQAIQLFKLTKKLDSISVPSYYLWLIFIYAYTPALYKLSEFLAYRIFRQSDVLNNSSGHLT